MELNPNHEFDQVLMLLKSMHDKKGTDYGTEEDEYANVSASREFGVATWVGALIRANDKMSRLKTFIKRKRLVNESVEDSLLDLAVYAIIGYILWRREQG